MRDPIYYTGDADVWCEDCAEQRFGGTGPDVTDHEGNELGAAFESSESDCPQHCAGCGAFLENALTPEGWHYTLQAIINDLADGRDSVSLTDWAPHYDIPTDLEPDVYADRFSIVEGAYWACVDYHAGQASRGYRHCSKLGRRYRPGASHGGVASLSNDALGAYVRVAVSLIHRP